MDFGTPSHRKDKKWLYYLTKYYFLLFKTEGCVSEYRNVENALLVGTADRVGDIGSAHAMQLNFSLSRTDTAIAIAETFHFYSTPSLIERIYSDMVFKFATSANLDNKSICMSEKSLRNGVGMFILRFV